MRVVWTAPALRELEAIGDYIARDNPSAAAKIVIRILDRADMLSDSPEMGRIGRIAGTRELVVTANAIHRSVPDMRRADRSAVRFPRRAALAGWFRLIGMQKAAGSPGGLIVIRG